MQILKYTSSLKNKVRIIFCLVLLEYLFFIFSGTSFSFLYGNSFFSLQADPFFWAVYLPGIPQFITKHQWLGVLLDASIVLFLIAFIKNPFNNKLALLLFLLLFLFYASFMGYHAHRNYQFGFFIVFIPFLFRSEINRSYAYEATRYFLLFFYLSAAYLKIISFAFTDPSLLSHMISGQFTPYYLEGNLGLRTNINLYLMNHQAITYVLYLTSIVIEFLAIIGFFTKKSDTCLAVLFLCFHFCNWFIMDIAPFGQIAFLGLLFLGNEMKLKRVESAII